MNKHLNLKYAISYLFIAAFTVLGITSCEKDKDEFEPVLMINVDGSRSVSNQPGEYSVDVVSNMSWVASTDADWITITDGEGEKGKAKFKYAVSKNTDDERSGKVIITTTDGHTAEFTVIQESGLSSDMYVTVNGKGSGSSWSDPTSLANALEQAPSGSTIFVAAGTYVPTKMITGGNPEDKSDLTFELNKYIVLQGGYPENPSQGATSDPQKNKTLLSGNLGGGDQSYHVVTVTAPKVEGQKVVIDGVTISHGNGFDRGSRVTINDTPFSRGNGGGMSIGNAIVEIINTDVVDNETSGASNVAGFCGGVFIHSNSVVTFRNCKINDNNSAGNGGGLYVDRSIAYVYDSEVNRNSGGTAAGVHAYPDAEIYMYNSSISDNRGKSYGAGFYARQKSKGVLVNCLIEGNETTSANGGGGIMMYDNCEVDVISTTITGNIVPGPGAGIYRRQNTNKLNIYNSIISGNSSKDDGPDVDVFEEAAIPPVINSTVIGKKAYGASGSEIDGATFDINSMLNSSFVPVGSNNPAISSGMSVDDLNNLKDTFTPSLDNLISSDMKGNSRSGLTTMGALVK